MDRDGHQAAMFIILPRPSRGLGKTTTPHEDQTDQDGHDAEDHVQPRYAHVLDESQVHEPRTQQQDR